MKYQVLVCACWLVLIALVIVGLDVVGAPWWTPSVAPLAILAVQQVYCQVLVPRGARARLLKAVDPTVGPPLGAAPVDSPLVGRLDTLSEAKDWDGLRGLLSEDFAVVVGKRRFGQGMYIRLLKTIARQLPGESTTDEMVVHPDDPDVVWVRATASSQPRFGPGFVSTTGTGFTLTADGSRVREIAGAGVLHVA
jgi:hypothetical protein